MSKFGVLVTGPAGAGKTTFCSALISYLHIQRRSTFYINLDPAASDFRSPPDLDIKDLISLQDVMEELHLGPNGGLIYCFEFLLENLDFLTDAIDGLTEEYLIILDLPGQIELYTHIPLLPLLAQHLMRSGSLHVSLCALYLLESTFVVDRAKFFAGTLSAMSAMIMLEMPHVNVLSKCDLLKSSGVGKKELKRFRNVDVGLMDDDDMEGLAENGGLVGSIDRADPTDTGSLMRGESFKQLNKAVARLIDDFSMVSFLQLDVQDEDSVAAILSYIDDAIQFHEAQEPKEPRDEIDDDFDM
ncbi:MAG: ATP binding protein [Vezdaea acicularis]|nr:MAG: ATP binding protein [Vezdaea acicularis]